MARKTKIPADSPAFWPLEADSSELQDYVNSRVRGPGRDAVSDDGSPIEPAWFREAFDASWAQALAEADAS